MTSLRGESDFHASQARFVNEQLAALKQRVYDSEERIRQLEKHIHYPHAQNAHLAKNNADGIRAMKEAAARVASSVESIRKVQERDATPMRTDVEAILTMTAFCKRLLDTHDLAYAVTLEVRNEARRALGLKEREV
jgi:predicted  nucleic acid-binding Zn-ribbon protein